jgi:hypothetical protein
MVGLLTIVILTNELFMFTATNNSGLLCTRLPVLLIMSQLQHQTDFFMGETKSVVISDGAFQCVWK